MTKKTIIITGATSGIGRATAIELVKTASILILPVRNMQKAQEFKTELLDINPDCTIDLVEVDFESIESIKSCANSIKSKYPIIDTLINNAGIMEPNFRLTVDGIESHFQVNVLSQFIFNTILTPNLIASKQGRIINLSSALHSQGKFMIDTLNTAPTGNLPGISLYSNSNLYRNMLTFSIAKELENTAVSVNCVHPGVIKTNLGSGGTNWVWNAIMPIFSLFTKPAEDGAKTSIHLALSEEGGKVTGKYWSNSKVAKVSESSHNLENIELLMNFCKKLV
jgi:retinol dehydrogenase 12